MLLTVGAREHCNVMVNKRLIHKTGNNCEVYARSELVSSLAVS